MHHVPKRYGFLINEHNDVLLVKDGELANYKEAMSNIDSKRWLEAMKIEIDSMYDNHVLSLVDPPKGVKPIGCKWIFKRKTNMDGNMIIYKARLVIKYYKQRQGVDFDETFSHIVILKSIRILLAIMINYDYEIRQMDVKTIFLNGDLVKDVYMKQLEGFESINSQKLCKLQRSIYGLKQASRS